MSVLAWSTWSSMQEPGQEARDPVGSPYCIEDAETDAFLDIEAPFLDGEARKRRELDTMMNRSVLLAMVGLLVVFTICVARGGTVDGMEWIRDAIMPVPGLREARRAVMSVSNMVFRESGAQGSMTPLALVVAVTQEGADAGLHNDVLHALAPGFDAMGLNRTAVVWVLDSREEPPQGGVGGGWSIITLTRHNETTVEGLLATLVSEMQVGVLYVDSASVVLTVGGGDGLLQEVLDRDIGEDLALLPVSKDIGGRRGASNGSVGVVCPDPQYRAPAMEPPVVPLVDTSLLLAWPTVGSRGLFKDAEGWVRAHGSARAQPPGSTSFAINVLLNSRRDGEVREVGEGGEGGATILYRLVEGGAYMHRVVPGMG